MLADKILPLLEGVKQTGNDRWIAHCPGHEDKTPSLAIREVDDRLLVHCFAGCDVYEVVNVVGLELSDLFPENLNTKGSKPLSKPFPAADVLRCLSGETLFIQICADDLAKGEKLNPKDLDRLRLSASRFHSALAAGGLS